MLAFVGIKVGAGRRITSLSELGSEVLGIRALARRLPARDLADAPNIPQALRRFYELPILAAAERIARESTHPRTSST
jgi:hypothetical protein